MGALSVNYSVSENGKRAPQYTIDTDLSGEITFADLLKFTKNSLIIISTDVLKEEQGKGFDKKPVLIVDNKFNKAITDVDPLGKIEFVARQSVKKIVLDMWDKIDEKMKRVTGNYATSGVVLFNGKQIAVDRKGLEVWLDNNTTFSDKDRIRFLNTAPYARRLERYGITKTSSGSGKLKLTSRKTKKGPTKIQQPHGAYALALRSIKSKYKKNSFMKFEYLSGSVIGLTGQGRSFKRGQNKGRPYLYPSIIISLVEAGLNQETP